MSIPELPFDHFPDLNEITNWMQSLAAAVPELVRFSTLGTSRGGLPIPMLTITNFSVGAPEDRPGYVIQGVLHADELAGIMVTLTIGRNLVVAHTAGDCLDKLVYYLIPCLNPDGANFVLTTGGTEFRSRMERTPLPNTIRQQDIDGDGLILSMLVENPNGNLVKDPKDPRLLIPRTADSTEPFYCQYPEGIVHDWDGGPIRGLNHYLDWNRNFPANWAPEPLQDAAGDYPLCEPETRALADFMVEHKKIFAFIGLHGGSGSVTVCPDIPIQDTIDYGDRALFREFGKLGEACTGYPFYIGTEFNLPPWRWMNPRGERHGSIADFGYFHLGIPAMEFELGSLKNQAGILTSDFETIQDMDGYNNKMRIVMNWLDKQSNPPPLFHPWKKCQHPQLGEIEIGGFDVRYMHTPTFPELKKVADRMTDFVLKQSAHAPDTYCQDLHADDMGGGIWRLRATVANRGHLPTCLTNMGRKLRRFTPPAIHFQPAEGTELLSEKRHLPIGHLDGFTGNQHLEWFVRASDSAALLGSARFTGGAGADFTITWRRRPSKDSIISTVSTPYHV